MRCLSAVNNLLLLELEPLCVYAITHFAILCLPNHFSLQFNLLLKLLDLLSKETLALSGLELILLGNYLAQFSLLMSTALLVI